MAASGYLAQPGIAPDIILQTIDTIPLTNGLMIEVFKNHRGLIPTLATKWSCKEKTLHRHLDRLNTKLRNLKKHVQRSGGKEKFDHFVEESFVIPSSKNSIPSTVSENKCDNCTGLLKVIDDEADVNKNKLKQANERSQRCILLMQKKLTAARRRIRKLNSEKSTRKRGPCTCRTHAKCKQLKEEMKLKSREITKLSASKKRASRRAEKYRQRYIRLAKKNSISPYKAVKKPIIIHQDQDIIHLHDRIAQLESEIADLKAPLATRDGKQFNTAVREASFYLQDIGVPEHHTSEAIKTVTETINGRRIGTLPSVSTQRRMGAEMKAVARRQVREALQDERNLTLKYDGTTKGRLGHLAEVEIATKEDTYMIGFTQQVGGTAAEYVESIKECCAAVSPTVLHEVRNTMTDRCSTNDAVDRILEDDTNVKINRFRCSMHPLDTFAKDCNKALKKLDRPVIVDKKCEMPFNNGGECNAQSLIRIASKLFSNECCGDSTDLKSFLREKGLDKQIPRWVGNRFNILFYSSGMLYHIGDAINDYFRLVNKPTNDLQRAFVNAWNSENKRHLRCLGLVGCLVARPWMETVSKDGNILEMNPLYDITLSKLIKWSEEPQSMLVDRCTVFGNPPVEDDVLTSLLSQPFEEDCHLPLRAILTSTIDVIKRQLKSQLPGGQFWEPSAVMKEQAASCVNNNISGERNFARLDSHLHHAPNIGVGKISSKVMFKSNGTRQWLQKKKSSVKKEIIRQSVGAGAKERKQEKKNKEAYREKVRRRVREKQQKVSEKAGKERTKVEELIESILNDGFFEERNVCDQYLNNYMSKTRSINCLKNQFNFRTKILGQDLGRHALIKCSVDQLKDIIFSAPVRPLDEDFLKYIKDPEQVLNKQFAFKCEEEGREKWHNATVVESKDGEFEIMYEGTNDPFFMTLAEFFTDVHLGSVTHTL